MFSSAVAAAADFVANACEKTLKIGCIFGAVVVLRNNCVFGWKMLLLQLILVMHDNLDRDDILSFANGYWYVCCTVSGGVFCLLPFVCCDCCLFFQYRTVRF